MNTNPKYVPALRWKGAEMRAVRELDPVAKSHIQPLIEFVPKDFQPSTEGGVAPPVELVIADNAKLLAENWGWRSPFFVDFLHIEPAIVPRAIDALDRQSASYGLKSILVTGVTPVVDVVMLRNLDMVKARGLCIRINAFEFRQGNLHRALLALVTNLRLSPGHIDLIVDFGVNPEGPSGIDKILKAIPTNEGDWRSITILGGSLPKDLSEIEKHSVEFIQRAEWLGWRRHALAGGTTWFGDYTILHPIFTDAEGKKFHVSASVRYTVGTATMILRGESIQKEGGLGAAQWPAHAQVLCEQPQFCGEPFSAGDRYIKVMSLQQEKTGGPKEWLFAGINHHLTYAVYQLTHIEATVDEAISLDADQPDWPAQFG